MAILILNAIPYHILDRQIKSESTSFANSVQQNDRPYDSPIITSTQITKNITIEWLAGELAQKSEVIKERTCRAIIESSIILLAQQKYIDSEKMSIKVPFTNIPMPSEVQATCGYLGKTMAILGGYVEQFSTNWDMSNNILTWNISIGVIDLKAERQPKEPPSSGAGAGSAEQNKIMIRKVLEAVPK